MPVDIELFKQGMRQLASSVCLVTTRGSDGARGGFTATAVCSVSAEPPTLLCCMNRANASADVFLHSGVFAVNLLGAQDMELSNLFAGALLPDARFAHGTWLAGVTGAPLLASAVVSFDCVTSQIVHAGTHSILIGQIRDIRLANSPSQPLLYGINTYGTFTPFTES